MVSAVSARGQLHFELFEGSMNAAKFIAFCKKLVHDCPPPVFLIVDGGSAHTAKAVKDYVASTKGELSIFFLPPYSPELNPDEWVWNNVKNTQIYRAVPMSQGHLWSIVKDALLRLQRLPEIVRGFFARIRTILLAYITRLYYSVVETHQIRVQKLIFRLVVPIFYLVIILAGWINVD